MNQTRVSIERRPKLCYRDKQGRELKIEELEPLLIDPDYKVVKQEVVDGYFISTVWLGVPYGMGCHYFETMVFLTPKGSEDPRDDLGKTLDCYRYCNLSEAKIGHEEVVKEWKGKVYESDE